MSGLLDWLDAPEPKPRTSHAPPWPAGKTTATMIAMAEGFAKALAPLVVEPGDAASLAIESLEAFLAAVRDHECHGRNWWAKHGSALEGRLRPLFPSIFPDPELDGQQLVRAVLKAFPDAKRLQIGLDPREILRSQNETPERGSVHDADVAKAIEHLRRGKGRIRVPIAVAEEVARRVKRGELRDVQDREIRELLEAIHPAQGSLK